MLCVDVTKLTNQRERTSIIAAAAAATNVDDDSTTAITITTTTAIIFANSGDELAQTFSTCLNKPVCQLNVFIISTVRMSIANNSSTIILFVCFSSFNIVVSLSLYVVVYVCIQDLGLYQSGRGWHVESDSMGF